MIKGIENIFPTLMGLDRDDPETTRIFGGVIEFFLGDEDHVFRLDSDGEFTANFAVKELHSKSGRNETTPNVLLYRYPEDSFIAPRVLWENGSAVFGGYFRDVRSSIGAYWPRSEFRYVGRVVYCG